jgi:asparagine synthase (glutamine-hydrolysing)
MCGITGIVDLRERRPINPALLRAMNDTLFRRGPDGEGFHFEPGVGFGHRRLSIIDLEGGKQPMFNEDGSIVVTYNGEIYNFHGIAEELVARGHVFRTRCDTEVIVHAWEEWGDECLSRFNGMFAFAIWDRNRETLFLARDRLGVKPLYYAELDDGELVFGSELKALLLHPLLGRDVDPTAVEEYFCFGYVPDPKTIFTRVRKLAPGWCLLAKRGQGAPRLQRYWDVDLESRDEPARAADRNIELELRERLREAVRLRLVSDVPLGAFLSGGIDSSSVVAMMRELETSRLLTCSIGFKEPRYDESRYAEIVARSKGTEHKSEVVEASDYGLLEKLVSLYDEPFADSSAIPTYRVCELARRHVTVTLSGDGGDEDFLGYRRYRLYAGEEALRAAIPAAIRQPVFGALGRLYPKLDWAPRFVRGKTTFEALARDSVSAYLHAVSIFPEQGRSALFSEDMTRELHGYRASEVFRGHLANRSFPDALKMVQYLDYKTYLPGDILTKVDRASMAHSLEVRVPFLDYTFVEWAAKLPSTAKLRRGEGKVVLKRALEPLLPREILYRAKMGFAVPLDVWFRGSLVDRMTASLEGAALTGCGLFRPEHLRRIGAEHRSGRRDHSPVLWALLMFEGFLRASSGAAAGHRPFLEGARAASA